MNDDLEHEPGFRRRDALLGLGGLGLGLGLVGYRVASDPSDAAAATCVLSREVTEGPYWVANSLTRRNVTDGRPGLPLRLQMTVVDATTCKAIKGADVEIWHADAGGVYSGVQGNSRRFLRGHQRSNASGVVVFDTIYPGWYRGRTPHIHLKVHVGGSVVHTGQVFFPDKVSAAVYRTSRYRSHGQADTTNGRDNIYAQAGAGRALLNLAKRGSGYKGSATLGVHR
jgi:protocatechuate 3,4-dioxygenase beta subunit